MPENALKSDKTVKGGGGVEDLQNLHTSALSELSSLGRVSHRLAMTEAGEPLENVLTLLLPRLLMRIGSNHKRTLDLVRSNTSASQSNSTSLAALLKGLYDKIHSKFVEMLSHIMKRVRADTNCKLPCDAILALLYDNETKIAQSPSEIDSFTLNLSLAFLTLGLPRCSTEKVESLLPGLLSMVGAHSGHSSLLSGARKNQCFQVGQLVLRAIEAIVSGSRKTEGNIRPSSSMLPPSASLGGTKSETMVDENKSFFQKSTKMIKSREICKVNDVTGAAVYDLLLDILLYQPVSAGSNLPPQGLSQFGNDRLISGASLVAKNWLAEFATQSRLRDLKLAILDFISPSRRWALFEDSTDENEEDGENNEILVGVGRARTVALLVATTGDFHADVSERATSYLKVHMDSLRNVSVPNTKNIDGKIDHDSFGKSSLLLGDPIKLLFEFLSLVLGGIVAETASSKTIENTLGERLEEMDSTTSNNVKTAVLSMKRRMVSDKTASALLNFIAVHILDGMPRIFSYISEKEYSNSKSSLEKSAGDAYGITKMVLLVVKHYLAPGTSTSGPSFTGSKDNPRVAAVCVLNSLCVRIVSFYDAISKSVEGNERKSSDAVNESSVIDQLYNHLAEALAAACSAVSVASSSHAGDTSSQSGIEIRDFCYGIICTISRSRVTVAQRGMLFNCGRVSTGSAKESSSFKSIDTAALLFGCAANEVETLRPRSVAALDALLGGYCRIYKKKKSEMEESMINHSDQSYVATTERNPWMELTNTTQVESSTGLDANFTALTRSLLPLIWSASQNSQPKASRLAAARWANELIKPIDLVNACHILCFLAGDSDTTTAHIAREGLGIGSQIGEDDILSVPIDSKKSNLLPDFNSAISVIFPKESSSWHPTFFDFSPRSQAAALRFGLKCLLYDLYGGEDAAIEDFISALSTTLLYFCPSSNITIDRQSREAIDLLEECSICLAGCLKTSLFARKKLVNKSLPFDHQHILNLTIYATSSKARRYFSEASGHLLEDVDIWNCKGENGTVDTELWMKNCSVVDTMSTCAAKLDEMHTTLFMAAEVHGAAYLGSRCLRAFRLSSFRFEKNDTSGSQCWVFASRILSALGKGCLHSDEAIGNACAQSLAIGMSYDGADAVILKKELFDGTANALVQLDIALRKYGNGDSTDPTRASYLAEATGVVLAASTSGAGSNYVSSQSPGTQTSTGIGAARLSCVDALFALLGSSAFRKDSEISLVTGEALTKYADAYSPEGAVWTSPSRQMPDDYDVAYASELPPHTQVIYTFLRKEIKASSPIKRTACAPAMLALAGHAARTVNSRPTSICRVFIKEILAHLSDFQAAFLSLLADPKSNQLARESCCLGLAACRGLSLAKNFNKEKELNKKFFEQNEDKTSHHLNDRLLKAFGQTTNFGGSALMETRTQHAQRSREENRNDGTASASEMMETFGMETEIGGASGMGEAALGAYREMAGAAVALGRPDILYSLMLLSVSHPLWSSPGFRDRYNALSLLGKGSDITGANGLEIRESLRPHIANLIPRLLRACNDPNKQTREQMDALWVGLTGGGAEARSLISEHLLTTIDILMDDATSKLWRARVGACGALSEVIIGRDWKSLGGGGPAIEDYIDSSAVLQGASARLLKLFQVTMRSLDDVRLTVRETGEKLARSLRSLVIRLCDPSAAELSGDEYYISNSSHSLKLQEEAFAASAASTVLKWLVKYGLNQPCAEATGFSVSCLLGVVEVSRPPTLQPVLAELTGSLLMAMSGLEPAALNYLQVRASSQDSNQAGNIGSYDRLERLRLQLAQSGPIAGALTKCLDMVKFVSLSSQKEVIPFIDSALRCGAGFATRAAAADAVSTLCSTCPLAFKFSGTSTTNPTVRLLRALYFASEREQGVGARDKMAHALGNLSAIAPGTSVRSLAVRACDRYKSATGSNDDPVSRRAAAAALRAIAVRASGQFADGGSNDIWCKRVLPMAFLGRKDKDIAPLWEDVWEEGGQAANLSSSSEGSSVGVSLQEKLLPQLRAACLEALKDVSWSRRVSACNALAELADTDILSPLSGSIEIDEIESHELNLRAERRAKASFEILTVCAKLIVKSRVWSGKESLVKTTVKVARKWIGWEKNMEKFQCLWNPIVKVDKWNDLFLCDKWFDGSRFVDDEAIESYDNTDSLNQRQATRMKNNDVDNGGENQLNQLDFEEGDRILNEEDNDLGPSEKSEIVVNESKNSLLFSGLCRALLEQAIPPNGKSDSSLNELDILPYRTAALRSLSELLDSAQKIVEGSRPQNDSRSTGLRYIYKMMAPALVSVVDGCQTIFPVDDFIGTREGKIPPVMVARSIDCLAAAFWSGMHRTSGNKYDDVTAISSLLYANCGGKQPAWTVREASGLALARLARKASIISMKKMDTIEIILNCASQCLKDKKFWKVRFAGLKMILSLCSRAGSSNDRVRHIGMAGVSLKMNDIEKEQQLMLEAILPSKEKILKIVRSSLNDNESKVTAIASDLCNTIAWWP